MHLRLMTVLAHVIQCQEPVGRYNGRERLEYRKGRGIDFEVSHDQVSGI